MEIPSQPQLEVDSNLSTKLYTALRMLRTVLREEAGEGVSAFHIFRNSTLHEISMRIPRTKEKLLEIPGIGNAKVNRFGDRLLETIEATVKEHNKTQRNCRISNDSSDSAKRRRDDDDSIGSTGWSKKRLSKKQVRSADQFNSSVDVDLDFDGLKSDAESNSLDPKVDQNGGRGFHSHGQCWKVEVTVKVVFCS